MGRNAAWHRARAGFVSIAVFGWTTPAEADDSHVLTYEAPPECPSEDAIRADVAKHVHDTSRAAGAEIHLRITQREGEFDAELTAIDATGHQGQRSFHGSTCADVAQALAFSAALAIELGGRIESDPAPPPKPLPTPVPPRRAEPVHPAPPAPIAPTPSLALGAVAMAELRGGLAPAPRPAGQLGFDVEDARPRIFAPAARLAVVVGTSSIDVPEGSAELWLFAGRLEACPVRFGNATLSVRPCAGAEVGPVWARGDIDVSPRSTTKLWASAEGLLQLRWLLTAGFFIEAEGSAVVVLSRTRYFFQPDSTIYVVPLVTGRAGVGVGVRFELSPGEK